MKKIRYRKLTKKQKEELRSKIEVLENFEKEYRAKRHQLAKNCGHILNQIVGAGTVPVGTHFRKDFKFSKKESNKIRIVTSLNISLSSSSNYIATVKHIIETGKYNPENVYVIFKTLDRLGRPNGSEKSVRWHLFKRWCEIVK